MELLRQTWLNLKANRTRSFLTMFGIAWGLVCLILMNAMGEGMLVAQKQKARSLGQNIMIVWGGVTSKGYQGVRAGKVVNLTLDDFFMVRAQSTHITRSSPELQRYLAARSDINNGTFSTAGVFADYMQMRTIEVAPGSRQITEGDNDRATRVCILGDDALHRQRRRRKKVRSAPAVRQKKQLSVGLRRRRVGRRTKQRSAGAKWRRRPRQPALARLGRNAQAPRRSAPMPKRSSTRGRTGR